MKRVYKLDEIDCPNCAAKLERAITKVDGVKNAGINFFAQKLTVEIEDDRFDEVIENVIKTVARQQPGCKVITQQ